MKLIKVATIPNEYRVDVVLNPCNDKHELHRIAKKKARTGCGFELSSKEDFKHQPHKHLDNEARMALVDKCNNTKCRPLCKISRCKRDGCFG